MVLRPLDGDSGLGVVHFRAGKALRSQTSCPPFVLPESQLNYPQDSEEGPANVVELT